MEKSLKMQKMYGSIRIRDILFPCSFHGKGARDHKEVKESMNKYELAVVLSMKLEDEERADAIEKVKGYITRFGGTVTNVDEWGKKRLAYEIQKMNEGFYYFIQFDAEPDVPAEVEADVRIMDNVLRFLCVKKDEA